MLSKESTSIAFPLAVKYAEQGKAITAKPGSVVAELTALSLDANTLAYSPSDPIEVIGQYIAADVEMKTESSVDCPTPHSLAKDRITDEIARFSAEHISYAKNEVKPVCEQVTKGIYDFLSGTAAKKAEQSITFIEYRLPDLLRDEEFLSSISYTDGRTMLAPEQILSLSAKTKEEIFQHLLTNQKSIDEMVLPWASLLSGELLQDVWINFFTKISTVNYKNFMNFNTITGMGITERIDIAMCLYLIATSLQANVEKTEDSLSLVKYNLYLSQMKDFAAGLLWSGAHTFSLYEKTRTLIIGIGMDYKSVLVFEPVYRKFLSEGGTPEAILGVIASRRDLRTADTILSQKEDLEKTWNSYVTYFNAAEVNKRIEYFRDFLIVFINELVFSKKITAIEDFRKENSSYDVTLKEKINDYINQLTLKDMECPSDMGLEIAGKCIFYFTDAYKLLKGIEEASTVNENIDVREAALLSAITYISEFVADQLVVS